MFVSHVYSYSCCLSSHVDGFCIGFPLCFIAALVVHHCSPGFTLLICFPSFLSVFCFSLMVLMCFQWVNIPNNSLWLTESVSFWSVSHGIPSDMHLPYFSLRSINFSINSSPYACQFILSDWQFGFICTYLVVNRVSIRTSQYIFLGFLSHPAIGVFWQHVLQHLFKVQFLFEPQQLQGSQCIPRVLPCYQLPSRHRLPWYSICLLLQRLPCSNPHCPVHWLGELGQC